MISYIDIVFALVIIIMTAVNAKRGFMVALIGMLRFIFIVPVSYFLVDYLTPYIPESYLEKIPEQAQGIVVFFAVFVILIVLTGIVMNILTKLQKKKGVPLRHTNAFLGGVFGFIKALIFISVISGVASLILDFIPENNQFYEIFNNSYIVDIVRNFNLDELKAFQA